MKILRSREVYHWPEFKALVERLCVSHESLTKGITIQLGPDPEDVVLITHSYIAREKGEPVDTTSLRNQCVRTSVPASGGGIS